MRQKQGDVLEKVIGNLEASMSKKGKGVYSFLWIGNPSQSYGASPAIWDHTLLPATRHR